MGTKMIVVIKYNRFKCCNCRKKFIPPFEFVEKNSRLSTSCKQYFQERVNKNDSVKNIAQDCGFSGTTGWRIIDNITFSIDLKGVTGLFFDEFKGNADGERYQLSIFDQEHNLITVLKDRKSKSIKEFLLLLDLSKIQFVCTDLYGPFRDLVKKTIPNVTYIADKYHFIRQLSWSIRDRRLAVYKSDTLKYRKCKTYWKLLAANPITSKSGRQISRLKEILNYDVHLKKLYEFQASFRVLCETRSNFEWQKKSYDNLLAELLLIGCEESKKLHSTLKNWQEEIINANLSGLSNGFVEGYNNKTKVLKRVSYGIKKFDHLHKLMHLRFNSRAVINFNY